MATSFRRRPKPSEVFAYLHCKDQDAFLAIQEDIFLRIADIVTEGGTGFAFPSQTKYFGRDSGVNAERARETEAKVDDWREHDRLPFPEFDPSLRRQMENVVDYPQRGAHDYKHRKGSSEDVQPASQTPSPSIPKSTR